MAVRVFTFLVGGKAGEGVKKAGSVAAELFASMGRRVFQMDDYQSLIRGGHNFSVVSTSAGAVDSHFMSADLVVALDARSYEVHRGHVRDGGTIVHNSDTVDGDGVGVAMTTEAEKLPNPELRVGVAAVSVLGAAIGLDREALARCVADGYGRDTERNVAYATAIYDAVSGKLGGRFSLGRGPGRLPILSGNQAIALGAAAAGLDLYLAYPMTPSSSLLHYLAAHERDLGVVTMHPESEIAVANIAVGAAFSGARVMVGTSGGGYALMEEALSLAGMTEAPLLTVLSSRPGPSTGVPTYTEQADLRFALGQGHGEFPRVVASPGSISEAFDLAAEMLDLVWRFQAVGILLTEKHLSESAATVEIDVDGAAWADPLIHGGGDYMRYRDTGSGVSPMLFPPSKGVVKWNSYEHDEAGITTEDGPTIAAMHDKRNRKGDAMVGYIRERRTVNRFGSSGPPIVTYGSTTMSVLEAVRAGGIEARVVQPVYLEPFPAWELESLRDERPVVVEQSSTGQFAALLREKCGIEPAAVVRRYDGRPFDPDELARELERSLG